MTYFRFCFLCVGKDKMLPTDEQQKGKGATCWFDMCGSKMMICFDSLIPVVVVVLDFPICTVWIWFVCVVFGFSFVLLLGL